MLMYPMVIVRSQRGRIFEKRWKWTVRDYMTWSEVNVIFSYFFFLFIFWSTERINANDDECRGRLPIRRTSVVPSAVYKYCVVIHYIIYYIYVDMISLVKRRLLFNISQGLAYFRKTEERWFETVCILYFFEVCAFRAQRGKVSLFRNIKKKNAFLSIETTKRLENTSVFFFRSRNPVRIVSASLCSARVFPFKYVLYILLNKTSLFEAFGLVTL